MPAKEAGVAVAHGEIPLFARLSSSGQLVCQTGTPERRHVRIVSPGRRLWVRTSGVVRREDAQVVDAGALHQPDESVPEHRVCRLEHFLSQRLHVAKCGLDALRRRRAGGFLKRRILGAELAQTFPEEARELDHGADVVQVRSVGAVRVLRMEVVC